MSSVLMDFGWAQWKVKNSEGRDYIEWAIALDRRNVDACIALAETYREDNDMDGALEWYENVYRISPSEPRHWESLSIARPSWSGILSLFR